MKITKELNPDHYNTISQHSIAEFKDRGSRFLAYVYPITSIEDFKNNLAHLRKEHPKAAHQCFAYRIGADGTKFRVSDDGEPSGSAGRPILGQIDSKGLTNVLVVVVRYFGGTLLGVPGLINAYKTATNYALEISGIIQKPVLLDYLLEFDYTQMNDVMRIIKQLDCVVLKQDPGSYLEQLFCSMKIGVPKFRNEELRKRLTEIRGLKQTAG